MRSDLRRERKHGRHTHRLGALFVLGLAWALLRWPAGATPPSLTQADKFAILDSMITEVGVARKPLPPDSKGIMIDSTGKVLNQSHVQSQLASDKASQVGSRLTVSAINFKDDSIVILLNGGPRKSHWYNHLEFGVGGPDAYDPNVAAPSAPGADQPDAAPAGGSPSAPTPDGDAAPEYETVTPMYKQAPSNGALITLKFNGKLPHMTPDDLRHYLGSLIDWDPPSKAEVMVQQLPSPVRQAIEAHHVLVGMNTDMVVAALGRTDNKQRATDPDTGMAYEDWIYGTPPNSTFVRIEGDRVVRVTTYKADGTMVVQDTPDPAFTAHPDAPSPAGASAAGGAANASGQSQPQNPAPSLRQPGETEPPVPTSTTPLPPPISAPPGSGGNGAPPTPPSAPSMCCRLP